MPGGVHARRRQPTQAPATGEGTALPNSPAFGQADLSNCERELIHLAGSIQPHGVLLVVDASDFAVTQASANCGAVLGVDFDDLLKSKVDVLGPALAGQLRELAPSLQPEETRPLQVRLGRLGRHGGSFEGTVHRHPAQGLIVELEPSASNGGAQTVSLDSELLIERMAAAVQRLGAASNQALLLDAVVQIFRDLTGYDRVMAYRFDPDGHGKIVAEARHPRLDTLLGHHYPASDIPQRARELYLRNRVRVLVDVHYEAVPIEPRLQPRTGGELDMSLCYLRSMSPLHIQYLKNMGVNATLVVSLVREGRLWGLIACHHDSPRNLRYPVRAACEMLAEVISTRLAAIENYAHAQVDLLVRRLEQRLVEATSTEGDWRLALFRNPRTLLQPLEATGAALYYEGEILTGGEVPSTPELRALLGWIGAQATDPVFSCASVAKAKPELASLTPVASGVLAVKLSSSRPDYLVWFRKEQLQTVTWAGDPSKPVVRDDPLELSPRRSFAAWSEIVRGTALPWSNKELLFARAIGSALIDIIVQVYAVRLLIAEHQIAQIRSTIGNSKEPVLVASVSGASLFSNPAFCALVGRDREGLFDGTQPGVAGLAHLFAEQATARAMLQRLQERHEAWRGDIQIARPDGRSVPVSVRAEVVPGRDGNVLGFIVILIDRTESRRAAAALEHLEQSLSRTAQAAPVPGSDLLREHGADALISAILANASMAAMDIADSAGVPAVALTLEELENSTQRAAALYARIREYGAPGRATD
jgi:two-component system, chemotaxis family, sensor kinase Cph1